MSNNVTKTGGNAVNVSTLMSPSPRWRTGLGDGRLGEDGRAQNKVHPGSHGTFIGGGFENDVRCFASVVVGGCNNYACSDFSFIGGGCGNTITGAHSAILGGCGNSDAGFAYAGVFGQNVAAVAANTFHVESINTCNMPNYTGAVGPITLAVGTLYYCNVGGGRCQVFLS